MTSDTPLWAREIKSKNEIPKKFIGHIDPYVLSMENLPLMIHMPQHPNEENIALDKIIYSYEDNIYLLKELDNGKIESFTLNTKDIFSVEHGKILLYSWLRLKTPGEFSDGLFMDFNTVMEPLFKNLIDIVRLSNKSKHHVDLNYSEAYDIKSLDYKFQNYINDVLDEGFVIRYLLFQNPFISSKENKEMTYNHITFLTDGELINIKEEPDKTNPSKLCVIWNFVSLSNIDKIDIKDYADNDYVSLEITSLNVKHNLGLFEEKNKEHLYHLISTVKDLKN
mgnify:FL=1